MTDTRAHVTISEGRERERAPGDQASGPIDVVAAETFGWIHPDVAARPPLRRSREVHVTRLGIVAVVLAAIGVIVSWFGPWGAGFGLVGVVIGIVSAARRTQPRGWCWTAILGGSASILFSVYWAAWIATQLTAVTPPT